jgi:hypothetical protein
MLGNYDYLENLDYLQLYYPLFSEGYALAFAEYTQTFVLQYYGAFHGGSTTAGATATTCNIVPGSAGDVDAGVSACQLTFTQTLKSVFPLIDASAGTPNRLSKADSGNLFERSVFECFSCCMVSQLWLTLSSAGVATRLRASVFHPTRTGGTAIPSLTTTPLLRFKHRSPLGTATTDAQATNTAETLTFKHIFGRATILTGAEAESAAYHDLTPLTNTGASINTASVVGNFSYTNGKYTITDANNLKQKTKKCSAGPPPGNAPCGQAYTGWSVKVVSMSASITSLKVIWKHVRA